MSTQSKRVGRNRSEGLLRRIREKKARSNNYKLDNTALHDKSKQTMFENVGRK